MSDEKYIQSRRDTIQAGGNVTQIGGDYIAGDKVTNNYYPPPPSSPPLSRDQVCTAFYQASSVLRVYNGEIAGIHLERAEVGQIVEWISSAPPEERLGMLLDQPGSGKTVVMRDVLVQLEADDIPALAIKADQLSGIRTKDELVAHLELPAPIEACMRQLTLEGPVVILLDQLDALSLALSRDQTTLDLMLSLLARLRDHEHVRIIASCRSFDLKNDPYLSNITADRKFQLQPLNEVQVNRVLHTVGADPAHLLPAHRALLTTPLHLDIYARIVIDDPASQAEKFYSLQELYEALWRKQIERVPPEPPTPATRIAAIYRLVDHMQARCQLTAPVAVLDEHIEAAGYLERVGFIRREKNNWLLMHQTLFDYCYARRFVAHGQSLSHAIVSGSQGLFERSQMVQVLAYLRGSDLVSYRRELTKLLFTQSLRTHLRLLLIGWFGGLSNPTADEIRLARRMLQDVDDQAQFLQAAGGNLHWFDVLDNRLSPLLLQTRETERVDVIIKYLGSLIEQRTNPVLAHLQPYVGRSETWNVRIAFCLSRIEQWQSAEALDMLGDLLTRGHVSQWVSLCMHHLSQANPAAGCLVLCAYLDRRVDNLLQQEPTRSEDSEAAYRSSPPDRPIWGQYLFGELGVSELAASAAQAAPAQFVKHLLPWFVRTSVLLTEWWQDETYPADPLFALGWYGDHRSEGPAFARWMADAFVQLAQTQPSAFRVWVAELITVDSLAVQRLVVEGYLANPGLYADDIFTYLLADKRRLSIGEMLESPHYDSCRLYSAVFPHLDGEHRSVLGQMILDLWPAREQSRPPQRGITQLHFLQNVDPGLLSKTAYRRLQELERKFPGFEQPPPQGIRIGLVGPPIEETAQAKMSDEDWLRAMRTYDDAATWGVRHTDPAKGGIIELAFSFAKHVKTDPDQVYHLAKRFDATISLHYVQAAISGLAESDAPVEWVCDLIRQFAPRIEGKFRKRICNALEQRAEAGIPDDLLDLLTDWALHDPDPAEEMWVMSAGSSDQHNYGSDLLIHGINTVRGAALQVVVSCALARKPAQVERVNRLLEVSANDPSIAVRTCVVERLRVLLSYDAERTVAIFERVLAGHPELLQTSVAHDLLYRLHSHHFAHIRPFIEAMLSNEDDATRQAAARLVCLAAFHYPEAIPLTEQVIQGEAVLRRGAAQVYAHNLGEQDVEAFCQERLCQLMHDPDEEVRTYVGECFKCMHPEQVHHLQAFIEAFLASPALSSGARHLIKYLKPLAGDKHELALHATERLIDAFGHHICNIQTSVSLLERDLAWLPLTVYTHAHDDRTRSQAMSIFEQLLLLGSWTAQEALTEWDRQ